MVVLKFGGSSLKSIGLIKEVAKKIIEIKKKEKKVVVVVSAMGKTTDNFYKDINSINKNASKDLIDCLLNLGELKSVFLLSICIESFGEKVVGLNGGQAGIIAGGNHTNGFIKKINTNIINNLLNDNKIVVVAGFCGETQDKKIITLGRGGSDTTAVAIASAFKCKCVIYTDVNAVSALDPRVFSDAKKYNQISTDDMLEFSAFGAKVLETRCVELAKKNNINIELTDPCESDKTIISDNFENLNICGVSLIEKVVSFSIVANNYKKELILDVFKDCLSKLFMLQFSNFKDIIKIKTAILQTDLEKISKKCKKYANSVNILQNLSIVSIVGYGFVSHVQNVINIINKLTNSGFKIVKTAQTERVFNILCEEEDAVKIMAYLKNLLHL